MARLLLTSSQVSVVLSSTIIFLFTLGLFLSGYIIQQRTVQSLQAALSPRAPFPRPNEPNHIQAQAGLNAAAQTRFPRLKSDYARLRTLLSTPKHRKSFSWNKLAYAQLVSDHSEVCNALILFAELHRSKSPAPRLLLFPRKWFSDTSSEDNAKFESIRRLLKKASRRYRVVLVPIGPISGDDKDGANGPEFYSMAALFALTNYDKVLILPSPGLVLNSVPLDSILAFHQGDEPLAAYPAVSDREIKLGSLLLVKPSTDAYNAIRTNVTTSAEDLMLISREAGTLLSEDNEELPPISAFATARSLRTTRPPFDAVRFSSETAFIHMVDTELPGPEFDVPYQDIVAARPKDADQGFIWEKMYSRYKDARYSVCGLDLAEWKPNKATVGPTKLDL